MSEQTRGKLSNQKPKMKSLFVPRLITISLCWLFLLVAPINSRLYHGTAYWPFVKFDILFDQDNIIDLWSISCIFGFVPQHATARKLSQLRTPQKTLSSDLDPPQIQRFAQSHCFPYHLLSLPRSLSDSVLSLTACITQTPKSTRSVEARNRRRATLVNFGNVREGRERERALIR